MDRLPCTTMLSGLAVACFSKVGGRFTSKEQFYQFHQEFEKFLPEYLLKIAAEQRSICAETFVKRWESESLPEYKKRQLRMAILLSKPPKFD
jgi:hypothetical protein